MVLRKQKEGAGTCRFSVDLQNGKTIRIPLIWYNTITMPLINLQMQQKQHTIKILFF